MKVPPFLRVYWPVLMAGSTVVISSAFDPAKGKELFPFSVSGGRLVTMLTRFCSGFAGG